MTDTPERDRADHAIWSFRNNVESDVDTKLPVVYGRSLTGYRSPDVRAELYRSNDDSPSFRVRFDAYRDDGWVLWKCYSDVEDPHVDGGWHSAHGPPESYRITGYMDADVILDELQARDAWVVETDV